MDFKKRGVLTLAITLVLSLTLLTFASAELFVSQPNTLYNIEDSLVSSLTVSPVIETNNFATVDLVCPNKETQVYKNSHHLKANEKKVIPIEIKLDPSVLGNIVGKCKLVAKYNTEISESQPFEITNFIKLELEVSGVAYNPGDSVVISGSAIKANSELLKGFVELQLSEVTTKASGIVTDGKFTMNFTLPAKTPAGLIVLSAKAYEKDSAGNLANEGNASISIRVAQKITTFEIATDSQEITPEQEITYKVILKDQTEKEMEKDVGITFYNPSNFDFLNRLIKSNQLIKLSTESNSTPGYWTIEAKVDSLTTKRQILIQEFPKVSFKLINNTLIVTNVGNVPYKKQIEVNIGGATELVNLDIPLNGEKMLKLTAPKGEYNIAVNDGKVSSSLGSTILTGRAITVTEKKSAIQGVAKIASWIIVVILLGFAAVYYYRKLDVSPIISRIPRAISSMKDRANFDSTKKEITLGGERTYAGIISLKISNLRELEQKKGQAFDAIESALDRLRRTDAKITAKGNERLIIMPLEEKDIRGGLIQAISQAEKIKNELDIANSETYYKAKYGLGVSLGEMIKETKTTGINYSALGNSISIAKKAAELAENELIVSNEAYKKVMGAIKGEKIPEKNAWKITHIPKRNMVESFMSKL